MKFYVIKLPKAISFIIVGILKLFKPEKQKKA